MFHMLSVSWHVIIGKEGVVHSDELAETLGMISTNHLVNC